MKKEIKIQGMMCEHCKKSVFDALSKICGGENVEVSLEKNSATVVFSGDNEVLKQAVDDIGFEVTEIKEK